jgi:hypothetical protein
VNNLSLAKLFLSVVAMSLLLALAGIAIRGGLSLEYGRLAGCFWAEVYAPVVSTVARLLVIVLTLVVLTALVFFNPCRHSFIPTLYDVLTHF